MSKKITKKKVQPIPEIPFIVLCIGDPHIQEKNIPEVNLFLERLYELANSKKPDLIVCLGDVLDKHETLHTDALNKAHEMLKTLSAISETFVLVGNHDLINNQIFLESKHWMNGMKEWDNVTVVDNVIHKSFKKGENTFDFVFCPYVYDGRFVEALNTGDKSLKSWENCDCIFAHQTFRGAKVGANFSLEGDIWEKNYPNVVSGHVHLNQTLENVYYCGSAMQNAFGQTEKPIIPILSFLKNKKYTLEEVDLQLPCKKTIYMTAEELEKYVPPSQETLEKHRIVLTDDPEIFTAIKKNKKFKDILKAGTKIVSKPKNKKMVSATAKNITSKLSENEHTDFRKILRMLIEEENNLILDKFYEEIIKEGKIERKMVEEV